MPFSTKYGAVRYFDVRQRLLTDTMLRYESLPTKSVALTHDLCQRWPTSYISRAKFNL
jgi:hypothetical protein